MNGKVITLIIVGVLILVGANAALFYFVLGDDDAASADAAAGEEGAPTEPPPDPVYVRLDAFTVTFDDPGSARFLQIEAYVVVDDEDAERLVEKHMPVARSALVMLFASQTAQALASASGKERLRQESLETLQEVMTERIGEPLASDFLFTKFVMQ
jgi:flagellar FliL protein